MVVNHAIVRILFWAEILIPMVTMFWDGLAMQLFSALEFRSSTYELWS